MKRLGLVLCLLALAGCAAGSSAVCVGCYSGEVVYQPQQYNTKVERFVDTDYGVVCYLQPTYAISCLPLADTGLAE